MSILPLLPEYNGHDPVPIEDGPSSPPYSQSLHHTEHALPTGRLPHVPLAQPLSMDTESLWCSSHSYCYHGSMLSVSLGRRIWPGVRYPVYGAQSEVQGTIRLNSRCTHVYKVSVTLTGKCTVNASAPGTARVNGAVSHISSIKFVQETVVLPNPAQDPSGFYPTDHSYYFSLALPTKCKHTDDAPPPSYTLWSPGASCEVVYSIKVDVYRKGLRRHEEQRVPIQYLPKSWPTRAPSRDSASGTEALKTIRLRHIWPEGACPVKAAKATIPTVLVTIPTGTSVSSGYYMPFRVTIHSPQAPALAKLLASSIDVRLTKRTKAYLHGRPVDSHELVLESATLVEIDSAREGYTVVHLAVPVGKPGREQSWSVSGLLEVLYHLRISVRAPENAKAYLPIYAHDERLEIATEPWGSRERETLSLGGAAAPALGLLHPRLVGNLDLGPRASASW